MRDNVGILYHSVYRKYAKCPENMQKMCRKCAENELLLNTTFSVYIIVFIFNLDLKVFLHNWYIFGYLNLSFNVILINSSLDLL